MTSKDKPMRIAQKMAHAGLCSRREAERWIADGRVAVNGATLTTPACTVSDEDEIAVDGETIGRAPKTRLWIYHKPRGLVTSQRDEQGRETVFDHLPEELGRVVSVGRLDKNSEGLLLLTNYGPLARFFEHPEQGFSRRYKVRVDGALDPRQIAQLEGGMVVERVHYAGVKVAPIGRRDARNQWVEMTLQEGKNREIRRLMEACGLKVSRLIRTHYGPFGLQDLPIGAVEEIPRKLWMPHVSKDLELR